MILRFAPWQALSNDQIYREQPATQLRAQKAVAKVHRSFTCRWINN
jgi:hypothetical protein